MGNAGGSSVYGRAMLQTVLEMSELWRGLGAGQRSLCKSVWIYEGYYYYYYFIYIYHVERSWCPPALVGRPGDGVMEGLGRGIGTLRFVKASDGSFTQGIPLGLH